MSDNNITLSSSNRYYLPSNVSNNIYLFTYDVIIEINKSNLKAISKIDGSPCRHWWSGGNAFLKDSRWNFITNSQCAGSLSTCGTVDGSLLSDGYIKDKTTGETAFFFGSDGRTNLSFDGNNFFVLIYDSGGITYNQKDKSLVIYDANFVRLSQYSTSAYLYNSRESIIVSNGNGGMWFLGCNSSNECFVTTATIVEQ